MDLLEYWRVMMPQLLKAGVDGSGVLVREGEVPFFFGRAVDAVRRLRSVRCFYLLAEMLGTLECSRDFLQQRGLDREVAAAERIPESMTEAALEQLKEELCTFSNPYIHVTNVMTTKLLEIIEESGWDEEFFQLVAKLRTAIAQLLPLINAVRVGGGRGGFDPRLIC